MTASSLSRGMVVSPLREMAVGWGIAGVTFGLWPTGDEHHWRHFNYESALRRVERLEGIAKLKLLYGSSPTFHIELVAAYRHKPSKIDTLLAWLEHALHATAICGKVTKQMEWEPDRASSLVEGSKAKVANPSVMYWRWEFLINLDSCLRYAKMS